MWNATFSYEHREGGLLSRGGVTSSRLAASGERIEAGTRTDAIVQVTGQQPAWELQ